MRQFLAIVAAATVLAACADSGPVTVHVYDLDPDAKTYAERDVHLDDLSDLTEMRGDTVQFVGGATIVADLVAAQNDPKGNQTLRAEGGGPPACSFSERDGVFHANDYDSLDMASAYVALWRSRALFLGLGLKPEELNTIRAFYHPRIELGTKLVPTFFVLTDNAAYAPSFDGFLIVPHVAIPGTPFTTNQGVMSHEYGHKVFNRLVDHGSPVQTWLKNDWPVVAQKQLRGVDEGLADVFGYLATNDPNYIAASLGGQTFGIDRDMSVTRVLDDAYADKVLSVPGQGQVDDYDPHELGGYVAAAMWRIGEDFKDHRRVALAVLAAERELGDAIADKPGYDFSTLEMLSRIASQFDGADRAHVCQVLKDRFPGLLSRDTAHSIEACP